MGGKGKQVGEQSLETRKGGRPLPADGASAHVGNLRAGVKPTSRLSPWRQGSATAMGTRQLLQSSADAALGGRWGYPTSQPF